MQFHEWVCYCSNCHKQTTFSRIAFDYLGNFYVSTLCQHCKQHDLRESNIMVLLDQCKEADNKHPQQNLCFTGNQTVN
jgi:hypothetical protein